MKRSRRWLLPTLVVALWIGLGGPLGSFAGRLSEVASNDNAAFLPASADSTRVATLQRSFRPRETIPAIIVWESSQGRVPAALTARAVGDLAKIRRLQGVAGPLSPPIPARDGKALQAIVPLDAGLGDKLVALVQAIRAAVADPPGATVFVTGPGGQLADLFDAFGGVDGLLLVVALVVVLGILLVVYRSPLLPVLVLFTAVLALGAASAAVYVLADKDVITLNGQSQGILSILVVGAATDYALLLVARYREELRENEASYDAMRVALRQSAEPILASGTTVILGVLCLLFSDLNSLKGLGPVSALGIAGSMVAALTFLPAALTLLGRKAFWPFRPAYGSRHSDEGGIWAAVAGLVSRRPRRVWIGTAVLLAALAAFSVTLKAEGIAQSDAFLNTVESVQGQDALSRHYPGGSGTPTVVIAPQDDVDRVVAVATRTTGVADATPLTAAGRPGAGGPPKVVAGRAEIDLTLTDASDSEAATRTISRLRTNLAALDRPVLVGGVTAEQLDAQQTAKRDRALVIPIVLVLILVVLMLLLRSAVAPLLLVATVVLSFAATLGVAAVVFNHVLDWPGSDPTTPLLGFVFLVALGIDYNIFLMTRVREESLRRGTRAGIRKGLSVTGGVITSAGIVLAATFSALAVLPLLFLAQIAFIVAFGVLLDTLVVRSLLVPALAYDIGARIWWPSRLGRAEGAAAATPDPDLGKE